MEYKRLAWNSGKHKDFICKLCGKSFFPKDRVKRVYCSKQCLKETRPKTRVNPRGELAYHWKGGVTAINKIQREKFRREIQKQVFKRDNYTCQICGEKGKDLQVDHIQSWKDYIELRFCIDNCRTLCVKCHYKITFGKPMPPRVKAWGHNLLKSQI